MTKALIISGKNFQDHEFIFPYYRLQEAGFEVVVAMKDGAPVQGILGVPWTPDRGLEGLSVDEFDILVLPGGAKAMEKIRLEPSVLKFIHDFNAAGKVIASICHAAQLLISARIVSGRKISGYYSIKDDIINAGAAYVDEPAVVDNNIISTAHYKDMGAWMQKALEVYAQR